MTDQAATQPHDQQEARTQQAADKARQAQEMAREANTLGAKCADADSAHLVVELKTELERMREQVQNVE